MEVGDKFNESQLKETGNEAILNIQIAEELLTPKASAQVCVT